MIQRVKLPVASPGAGTQPRRGDPVYPLFGRYRAKVGGFRALTSEQADDHLDDLVKHALSATAPRYRSCPGGDPEPDANRIWQQITRKVRGPFGTPALEAPAQTSLELELMTSGGRVEPVPFALSERALHSKEVPGAGAPACGSDPWWTKLRFLTSGISRTGDAWLFN